MDIKSSWLCKTPIAHRGLHTAELPENSLDAFENAIKHGYAIELDVRLLDDETIVVFHDDTLSRMTGADGYVCNIKKDDLNSLRLIGTDCVIPTLEETLELVGGRVPILIETKNSHKMGILETKTAKILSSYEGEIALQSFNPYSMEYFKKNAPQYWRGQLSTYFSKSDLSFFKRYLLKRLKMNHVSKPDFISYDFNYLPNHFVSRTGLPVIAWTIRSNAEMEAMLPHCDNIIFEKFIPEFTQSKE